MACKHCRGSARDEQYEGELTTEEGLRFLDNLGKFCKPILILTGGEPMFRPDIYEFAKRGTELGMKVVMAPCGHQLNDDTAQKLLASGVSHISLSIDGPDAASHDSFRGVPGAYDVVQNAIAVAQRNGISFQINTTVTRLNVDALPQMLDAVIAMGAKTWDLFFLVPTGRGSAIKDLEISPDRHENALNWVADTAAQAPIAMHTTCAPHYARVVRQKGMGRGPGRGASGCMAARGFLFVSHRGKVQPCGFLEAEFGDLRREDFNVQRIYEASPVAVEMRDVNLFHGKCGICEFRQACGGCRARAYGHTGDWMDSEPFCVHEPKQGMGE
jgi:radical SAM protein with 4Fe4S-binding SPASM domain